jgi:hypothetical protein
MRTSVALTGLFALAGLALSSTSARADDEAAPVPVPGSAAVVTTTYTTIGPKDKVPPGTVVVHLDSPEPVNLEHRGGIGIERNPWEPVCHAPCDMAVPAGDEYRVTGPTVNNSKSFILKSGEGQKVTLQVTPGKQSKATAGYVLLGTGAGLAIAGTLVIVFGSRGGKTFPGGEGGADTSTTNNANYNFILAGTGLILGGVVAGVVGGALAIDNAHTRVGAGNEKETGEKGTSPTTPTENPSEGGSTVVSSNHIPTFIDTQAHKLSAGVQTYTVPLFTKTF